jgi:hypothetical protein
MKKITSFLRLVLGACSVVEAQAENQRDIFFRNNLSLQSALKASIRKCDNPEAKAVLEDTWELARTLEFYRLEAPTNPMYYRVETRSGVEWKEETLNGEIIQPLLEAQAELHRAVASARKREDIDCLHLLEITRSSLATFLASAPSQPRAATSRQPPTLKKLTLPRSPPFVSESLWDRLHQMTRKSARFAIEDRLDAAHKQYTFRTKSLNPSLNEDCDIAIKVDEKTGSLTLEWFFKSSLPSVYPSGSITIPPGQDHIIPQTQDHGSVSGEQSYIVQKLSDSHNRVWQTTYFTTSSDGSLEGIIQKKKGSPDQGCSVTKFPTYEEDLPEIKVPSPTKPH